MKYGNGSIRYGNGSMRCGNGSMRYGNGSMRCGNGSMRYGVCTCIWYEIGIMRLLLLHIQMYI